MSKHDNIGINLVIVIVIVFFGFLSHHFLKDWSDYDAMMEKEELLAQQAEQQRLQQLSLEVGAMELPVANPIQAVMIEDRGIDVDGEVKDLQSQRS